MALLDRSLDMTRGVAKGVKQGIHSASKGIKDQAVTVGRRVQEAARVDPASQAADEQPPPAERTAERPERSAERRPPRERRRPAEPAVIEVPPLAEPRFGIDGWTFEGTALAGRFPIDTDGEAATLLHNVRRGFATPWTYNRLSDLLIRHGEREQALAVLETYLSEAARAEVDPDRGLLRRRNHLASQLAKARVRTRSGADQVVVRLRPAQSESAEHDRADDADTRDAAS
jgi:hypothetical protein